MAKRAIYSVWLKIYLFYLLGDGADCQYIGQVRIKSGINFELTEFDGVVHELRKDTSVCLSLT